MVLNSCLDSCNRRVSTSPRNRVKAVAQKNTIAQRHHVHSHELLTEQLVPEALSLAMRPSTNYSDAYPGLNSQSRTFAMPDVFK